MALLVERWLECRVFTKDLQLAGVVKARTSDAWSVSFTAEHNGVGVGSVTLGSDHPLVPAMLAPGARLQFRYLQAGNPPVVIEQMSGPRITPVETITPQLSHVTITSISDEYLLDNLAWPVPGNPIGSQTSEYDTRTGAADGIAHNIVAANLVSRLGLPVTMVPLFPSAPTTTIKARFHTLMEVVRPVLEDTGRGIRFWQWNPGDEVPFFLSGALTVPTILCEVFTAVDRPYVVWTTHLGITSATVSTSAPTATRVIVGGQGEGTLRSFTSTVDPTRETEWGRLGLREVFVDARDTNDAATLAQRAADALQAGAEKASLSAETLDGEPWILGHHYNRGDRVKLSIAGVTYTDVVRRVTISANAESGTTVKPQVGDATAGAAPDEVLARTIRNLSARVRDLEARR